MATIPTPTVVNSNGLQTTKLTTTSTPYAQLTEKSNDNLANTIVEHKAAKVIQRFWRRHLQERTLQERVELTNGVPATFV